MQKQRKYVRTEIKIFCNIIIGFENIGTFTGQIFWFSQNERKMETVLKSLEVSKAFIFFNFTYL